MPIKVDPRCRYTESHEWVRFERDVATCGITDYAQDQLSDIVYVELPEVGDAFEQGQVYGVVESVKAASDCYMPVAGEIVAVNEALEETPETVNGDPYEAGWFVQIAVSSPEAGSTLMDAEAYVTFVQSLEGEAEEN